MALRGLSGASRRPKIKQPGRRYLSFGSNRIDQGARPHLPSKSPPHVAIPYAPTQKGKESEERAHSEGRNVAYQPPSPTAPVGGPSPSTSAARSTARHAEVRQAHLINRYVTHAYQQKVSRLGEAKTPLPTFEVGSRVEKAKHEVENLRQRLLTHPAVEKANAEGKVVAAKGLAKIDRREQQYHAIEGPKGVSSSKAFGLAPRSLSVGAKGQEELQRQQFLGNQGNVSRRLARGKAGAAAKAEPSTLEDLAYASIGIPGIGVGGDIARLAELGAQAIPKLATSEGASALAGRGAAAVAEKFAASRAAIKGIPTAVREGKEALRELPSALRAGVKAAPSAAKAGAKALPRASVGYAAKGAESNFKAVSGLAALGQGHRAGVDPFSVSTRADALLEGTAQAVEENPKRVAETTLRSLPAFITAPAGLSLAAGESAIQGSPKPLENTAGALGRGTVDILKKLGSGDEKTVQKTIEEEVGLTPYVPVPAVLRKLHSSDLYTAPRGAVRKGVESRRQAKRQTPSAEEGMRYGGGKEPQAPVPVSGRPGEHYVFRGFGSKHEAGKARREVALDTTRASAYGTTWGNLEAKGIVKAARSLHGHGTVSRLAKKMGPEYEASIWPMAKMGIPHTAEGHALTKQLAEFYGKPDQPPIPGSLTDRMAINAAAETPELFSDRGHAAMAEANRESAGRLAAKTTHNSERAARIPQNDFTNYLRVKEGKAPVLKPEERITKQAEKFTSTDEAAKALRHQADALLAKAEKTKNETKAAGLRAEAQGLKQEAEHVIKSGVVSRRSAWAHYQELNAEYDRLRKEGNKEAAKSVLQQKKSLYAELKQYTHPEHVLDKSKLKGWSRGMVRDFVKEQDAVAREHGLHQGVYVADKRPVSPVNKAAMVERPFSSRAMHVKTGDLARSGEAEARFEAGLMHTVLGPRTRMAYNQLVHDTLNEGKIPVRVGNSYKHVLTEFELEHAARTHSLPADSVAIDLGVMKQALIGEHALTHEGISSLLEGMSHGESAAEALKALPADLKDEVLAAADRKSRKYAVVSRPRVQELIDQFASPKHPNWRKAASVPARLVLNDPAWVLSQLFATGIPIGASLGPSALLHAPRAIKVMADIQRKADPETQALIASVVGSSAGVWGVPEGAFRAVHDPFSNVRAIRHSSAGKKLWKLANGEVMGGWDRWNNAKMREFAAAVRSSKGFRNWYGGFRGMNDDMAKIAKATKGMKPTARLEYASRHYGRALQQDLNRMGGNWNSFMALERKVAPFVMFYPWIRYSLDWTFHVFPLHHPVAAAALAMTGQVNANELQKIAAVETRGTGAHIKASDPLANPLEYAYPVADGKVYPLGGRIAPTLGVVGTTLVGGKPANVLQGINPILGTGISLATNRNLFTGQELEGTIPQELANQAYNFSPALRLLARGIGFRGFGKGPQSALSKAYEQSDKGSAVRSVLLPTLPQSARNFALRNALSKVETIIGNTSSSARAAVQGDETLSTKERQTTVAKMKKEETAAFAVREKILKEISPALAKQSNEEYERYKAAGEEPSASIAGYGKGVGYGKTEGYEGGIGYGGGSGGNKALNFEGESGTHLHLPDLPNVSGSPLGVIGSMLGSLLEGTAAQAAVKAPGHKAAQNGPTFVQAAHSVTLKGPLTSGQKAFGKELSRLTGLSPKTVGGWMLAEDNGSAAAGKEVSGDQNWLNIGPGYNLGSDPRKAAAYTANLINTSHFYSGIRASVGKSVGAQVAAIQASPWDGAHYPNGIPTNLVGGSVAPGGDLQLGKNRKVYVRADAKGMVKWAHALLGTQEGSKLQRKWAAESGVSSAEPWCSEFIAAGLARRGLPQPANPAYSGTWLTWKGGKHIGTNVAQAKPGDVIVFGSNPGATTHVGLYVGSGKMISGNWGNEVAAAKVSEETEPIAGIIRPRYKGGKVAVKAGVALPGSLITSSGQVISAPLPISAGGSTTAASAASSPKAQRGEAKRTAAEKLKLVNEITAGNYAGLGVPQNSGVGPTAAQLAALGESLSADRLKLLRH